MLHAADSKSSPDSRTKRQQILDAAHVVFSRKGYYRATVDEIISLADTGKGTVYNYFVNKEQLFYTLVQERYAPFAKSLAGVVQADWPPLEKIRRMTALFLQFYLENGDLWRVIMHEIRGYGSEETGDFTQEQREKYCNHFKQTISMLEAVIAEGIDKGEFRQCDAHKVAHGLFSAIVTMVFSKFVSDVEEAAEGIADVFLHGIAK